MSIALQQTYYMQRKISSQWQLVSNFESIGEGEEDLEDED
jgi:hypothetical protein